MVTRRQLIRAAGAAGTLSAAGPAARAQIRAGQPLKVGFVYVSPVGDAGWTSQHDLGRRQLEQALGASVQTKFVESVQEGPDAERVLLDLASSGHGLIFGTSFGYMNPMEKVAAQFPNVVFEHATGYKTGRNLGIYNARFYEGRYLNGVVAGRMTKSNVLGYVAAFPIPEVLQGINAFARGARNVNPKAEVRVVWIQSWYDPGRERDAANTLMSLGADVVTHHTDSTAVVQAAEARGAMAFGYHSDMSRYGPKAQLSATTHHWGDYYVKTAKAVIAGTWKSGSVWGGIKDGFIRMAPLHASVPTPVRDEVARIEASIKAGNFHPFAGPVKAQNGKDVIAAGRHLSDDEMGKMNYYVDGVASPMPKN